jgi:AraC-like DNA-binding protein/anti-sigma regulatory factor (Ser/Thr protein kinase)
MPDAQQVDLATTGRIGEFVVASARGRVTSSAVVALQDGLAKLLAEGSPVLLDVSGLELEWAPAPEIFVMAVAGAGGWPVARLVLFGAEPAAAERLEAFRVTDSVPLVGTVDDAAVRIESRPAHLTRRVKLPGRPESVRRAREVVRDAVERWGLPPRDDAATIVTELVANAVRHSGTTLRLRLDLDRVGLRVSVRDHQPAAFEEQSPSGRGLQAVSRLSRSWGVLHYDDGTAVWAQLPPSPRTLTPTAADDRDRVRLPSDPAAGAAANAVTPSRRRRLVTADAEHAHAFLRSVYGEHVLRLSGMHDLSGGHLEYDGVATNRFAVEHLRHVAGGEGLFSPAQALVVVHALDGDLRICSRRDELHVAPGELVLYDAGADTRVGSTRLDVEVVRLEPAVVARLTAELTGFDAPTVPFELSRPVSEARAAHWRACVAHLRRDVLVNNEVMASPLVRATILRTLVAMLVETFPNPARDALGDPATDGGHVPPRAFRLAIRFIEEHAGDDIGLADIAAAAGIGARGLQLAFRRHADVTPLEHLRRVRLEGAHRNLQAGSPAEVTVGTIANRWGFPHHGNFSSLYLRTYGRSPSITLRS